VIAIKWIGVSPVVIARRFVPVPPLFFIMEKILPDSTVYKFDDATELCWKSLKTLAKKLLEKHELDCLVYSLQLEFRTDNPDLVECVNSNVKGFIDDYSVLD
jgi:hypothetical protein